MSCVGVARGRPSAGERMLFEDSISTRASAWASAERGTCTAIWSPSKSALNAWQTSGWTWIALPSTSTGSNAWMPRRWSVGARFRSTGCSAMTSSSTSHTSGTIVSTIFLAALMFCTSLRSTRRLMMNGLKSSSAISLGRPEVEQPLQAVVAVDDAPVEVGQVRRREPAAVELHHRAQLRRDHRHGLEDHPVRSVLGLDERVHDLEPLDRPGLLLALRRADRLAQARGLGLEVLRAQELADRLGAH